MRLNLLIANVLGIIFAGIINSSDAQTLKADSLINDGPYVFYENGKPRGYLIKNSEVKNADVLLKKELGIPPVEYRMPEKLFAVSDIEGELDAFRALLLGNKIIDQQENWIFDKGHLVICGDLFDRGLQVPEFLWFLYHLEDKAKEKGGYVHVILGNHDIMNLSGDFRYVQPKYFKAAKLLNREYKSLYGKDSELGRWLRSKNTMEKIGDMLFLHGGISPELIGYGWSLEQINKAARPYYDQKKADMPDSVKTLFGKNSLFWYRGYFLQPKITEQELQQTLDAFKASQIIVGHTIINKNIAMYYKGKVIGIDVNEHEGHRAGILYLNSKWFKTDDKGKQTELFYEPENDNIQESDIQ